MKQAGSRKRGGDVGVKLLCSDPFLEQNKGLLRKHGNLNVSWEGPGRGGVRGKSYA